MVHMWSFSMVDAWLFLIVNTWSFSMVDVWLFSLWEGILCWSAWGQGPLHSGLCHWALCCQHCRWWKAPTSGQCISHLWEPKKFWEVLLAGCGCTDSLWSLPACGGHGGRWHQHPQWHPRFQELYPGNYRPNVTHYFLRLLHDKGLLLRLYTQNIDGLERASGIPASKLVEAHGTFASATCTVCRRSFPGENFRVDVMAGRVPSCPVCTGVVKPDIVFFGEPLPHRFFLHVVDFPMADLLLILGTSLEVEPFASLSEAVGNSVPRVLINWNLVGSLASRPRSRDVARLGDVVRGVEELVELLGWTQDMQDLVQQETRKLDGLDK
ncbi:NAD-dependent protein deacetylase sirtuin-3, mitochondrial isoform X2 [Ochotona curzoniae]|uniref:NAD-dependent protein deacetylase sirtuin-3, mitochondrial isoform X2 n=1 Tax=Ochotona curzoniae TaxID=130825 RepID=UPI001B34CF0D|nr:NAD-dependent protein deacetylase sirtuin-3, mitochondrial isoform X2 [Ochotona curzoniae]